MLYIFYSFLLRLFKGLYSKFYAIANMSFYFPILRLHLYELNRRLECKKK